MRAGWLLLLLSGCAALRSGWARVEYAEGSIAPTMVCTSRIAGDGEVELACSKLNTAETDAMWRRERRRATGGDT